jgi:hypothetical protein
MKYPVHALSISNWKQIIKHLRSYSFVKPYLTVDMVYLGMIPNKDGNVGSPERGPSSIEERGPSSIVERRKAPISDQFQAFRTHRAARLSLAHDRSSLQLPTCQGVLGRVHWRRNRAPPTHPTTASKTVGTLVIPHRVVSHPPRLDTEPLPTHAHDTWARPTLALPISGRVSGLEVRLAACPFLHLFLPSRRNVP